MQPHPTAHTDFLSAATLPGRSASVANRRAHRRLPLQVSIEVQSTIPPEHVIERGVTTDISPGGLRFASFNWRQLPVGGRFHVAVSLPFESVMFTDRRRLTAPATVIRWIDDEPGTRRGVLPLRRGIAVRFDEPLAFAPSIQVRRKEPSE